ncbi:uncharacterized [Tachysurus ichikawai]
MQPLDITRLGSHMLNLAAQPPLPKHTPSVGPLKQHWPNKPHVTNETLIQSSTGCSTTCQIGSFVSLSFKGGSSPPPPPLSTRRFL